MEAGRRGGTAPAVFNAANEVAVEAFLEERLDFPSISAVVDMALGEAQTRPVTDVTDVLEADRTARAAACTVVDRMGSADRKSSVRKRGTGA